jgi:hypothetical protein
MAPDIIGYYSKAEKFQIEALGGRTIQPPDIDMTLKSG